MQWKIPENEPVPAEIKQSKDQKLCWYLRGDGVKLSGTYQGVILFETVDLNLFIL